MPCVARCACSSAPTTTPTVATMMAMETISSIKVNPFCRFIPSLLATLEFRNISLELVLARKFPGGVIDRHDYVANIVGRFAREIGNSNGASEICEWRFNVVRGAQLSVRSGINDEIGWGADIINRTHKSVRTGLKQWL